MLLISVIVFFCSQRLASVAAAPTLLERADNSTTVALTTREDFLEPIRNSYKGIHWDDAYSPTNDPAKCNFADFQILVEATRMALEMTRKFEYFRVENTAAYNRYFISPNINKVDGAKWHGSDKKGGPFWTFESIHHNIWNVNAFPRMGHRKYKNNKTYQITYRCDEMKDLPKKCRKPDETTGKWSGPAAYTGSPSYTQDGWQTFFCPRFFQEGKLQYINERTKKNHPQSSIGALDTFEAAIIHEWMHCDMIGTRFHVEDINATLPGSADVVPVYGESRCHEFGWLNAGTDAGVNLRVAYNADNYAWFFNYNWFDNFYDWLGDGSDISLGNFNDADPDLTQTYGPEDFSEYVNADSIDPSTIIELSNCHSTFDAASGNITVDCDSIGETYADFLADVNLPFKSDGDCDLSAGCNLSLDGIIVAPACTCTCNGALTDLNDARCAGYVGALPSTSSATPISTPAPAPISVEKLDCHGVSGNIWVTSRDTAVRNVADFCSQDLKSVEYNQGSFNDLILTVNYPTDQSKTPKDAPDCHNRFTNIVIDGCDGNDAVNNFHNFKYGATYTATDGWVYIMEPKAVHIDDDVCDITYKALLYEFEVRGKNFPDAKLGVDGAGLLQQLRGCGAVTDWHFELTPNDPRFEWYAYGNLPLGTKACAGRATMSAGGTTTGDCNGLT